jgi:hypothetical protein
VIAKVFPFLKQDSMGLSTVGAKSLAHAISMARLHSADNIIHTKQNFEKPF